MSPPRKVMGEPVLDAGSTEFLSSIRDLEPASSRNASKGALVRECHTVAQAFARGMSVPEAREAVLAAKLIPKGSFETRRSIWNAIHYRYLSACPRWVGGALAQASDAGATSQEFLSLLYLHFALRNRLIFDFVTGPLWQKWSTQSTAIDRGDFQSFLESRPDVQKVVRKWHTSTRMKIASNALSALRDFGVLRGLRNKQIQRPPSSPEVVFHIVSILVAEGHEGRSVVEAPDWRLFFWGEDEISRALNDLAQRGWMRFEKGGRTVILSLVRGASGCDAEKREMGEP